MCCVCIEDQNQLPVAGFYYFAFFFAYYLFANILCRLKRYILGKSNRHCCAKYFVLIELCWLSGKPAATQSSGIKLLLAALKGGHLPR